MNLFDRLCDRCHKRMAAVFVTRIDGNSKKVEGICLACAKELKIPYVSELLDKMGISDDDIDFMTEELGNIAKSGMLPFDINNIDDLDEIGNSITEALGGAYSDDDENFPGSNVSMADYMNMIKEAGNFLPKAFQVIGNLQDKSDRN